MLYHLESCENMYLSRVEIDDRSRQKIKELSHLGAYHNWVEQCFPNEMENQERLRHLWRIDTLGGNRYLLILSPQKPSITKLEKYGVEGTAQIKPYDNYLNSLKNGQTLRFRIVANPVARHNGKVIKHTTHTSNDTEYLNMMDRQREWLIKRSEINGFQITKNMEGTYNFDIVSHGTQPLYHKNNKRVLLKHAAYEGVLKITDVEKFRLALQNGIGREKAYGMGLITVIPMN